MTVLELRRAIREVILEAREVPVVWYHGSPWSDMGELSGYKGDVMFVTDSRQVAADYTRELIGTGRRPSDEAEPGPTLYALHLNFAEERIFDTRRPEHLKLFMALVKEARADDPEDPSLRKSDLVTVHPAHGSSIGGTFPSYGCVRYLIEKLKPRGFVAVLTAEGAQGASLAVSDPGKNLKRAVHNA